MTDINKQKFLAELSQLLTFMYEEDRQDALLVYSGMFDEAEDEKALLQALVSPIRQAVLVARAYNATERKLQTRSQSRSEAGAPRDDKVAPDFLQAIFAIRADVLSTQPVHEPAVPEDENQFSLFDLAGQTQDALLPSESPDGTPDAPSEEEREPTQPENEEARVDAFMADFHVADAEAAAPEAETPARDAEPADDSQALDADEAEADEERFVVIQDRSDVPVEERTVLKPRVLLLILYTLLAIPITLAGILLLLLPTAVSLGAAALLVSVGVMAAVSVFGGFAVLADLLVVLGATLILLALGLLFLWLFIWFIFGAIVGLIRGICALGRHWCYKEVPAI